MDMEGALRARLLAAAPVTALVAQRIYWDERPQTSTLPDVTLHLIVDHREQHMGGFQELLKGELQIDVRAATFAGKKALKEAVVAAVASANTANGIHFDAATQVLAHPLNEQTETQFIYRDVVECRLHYRTA
jgi:hypothetical protein